MKVYYAHPISEYDTDEERMTVKILQNAFEVVNPNSDEIDQAYNKDKDFTVFLDAIKSCDAVVFTPFKDGKISAGVAKEIEFAFDSYIPVLEYSRNLDERYLTKDQTIERLKASGHR